jgi:putative transposase
MSSINDMPNPEFEASRQRLDVQIGALVKSENVIYRIEQIIDFESVVGTAVETGRSKPLRILELQSIGNDDPTVKHDVHWDIAGIGDSDWKVAETRFAAIHPLISAISPGRREVDLRAKEVGVNTATLYRWLQKYKGMRNVAALIPRKSGWIQGKGRIPIQAEAVVADVIKNYYLTPQRPSATKAVTEVLRQCLLRGVKAPHPTTIRSRIAVVSEKERLRGRGFKEKAKNKFLPVPGHYPKTSFPLEVVQIDHTPVDLILVDDLYRKPIGRPWISLAIDVDSRVITGYYLSFDAPSETSVAMCVAHSVLPKEEWLMLHKVEATWPVWGVPQKIYVDNGSDFRSDNFQQSCSMYGIHLEFRPVKNPRYGGHIERLVGTFMKEVHDLPGTTFSNIKAREGYDSEKHATMTKSEFETWLVTLICKIYHQRMHSGIGMSPMRKWEIGIFGNGSVQGVGIPSVPVNRQTVLLDFLPHFLRTIQAFGVTIDGMTYYADILRQWINAGDPNDRTKKREFIFRRDPRDISTIWFFDPEITQYFKVPFADQALPPMSIWEYQQARDALRREGKKSVNEHQILNALTELRTQVDESKERTKKARRQSQRRKEHEKKVSPAAPLPQPIQTKTILLSTASGLVDGDVDSYGDIA